MNQNPVTRPGLARAGSLHIHHSNRLELLATELAGLIASAPVDPLEAERIVVPHRTLGRWLQLEIARELGIAANIECELPAAFAWSMLRDTLPSLPREQGFAPDTLRWHLFELLPAFSQGDDAREVRQYLADGDELKRFELADRLARILDRCLNFRDDWIRDWERGGTPHWQARLWQSLAENVQEQHWVHALDAFGKVLANGEMPGNWPRRVFVFGISFLSPSYLQWLRQLAGKIELHVFLLNPSEAYWADLRTEREIRRQADASQAEAQHFEEGNRLLAAWGRAGRDAFEELIASEAQTRSCFAPTRDDSRLAAVQGDIQEVRPAADAPRVPPDSSLQIHCCHSAMREAEVLHDRLLDLLETHSDIEPDIEPADILILTPKPARYGPAITAVFESEGRIPVALSRSRAVDSPTAKAFFDLLSLPGTRFGVEAVLAPLEAPSLRARFEIGEGQLPDIRDWVKQAGIRRNIASEGDAAPALPGNTWQDGFNRLLVGYAAGDTDELALGIAPCSIRGEGGFEAGEEDYAAVGRVISYCQAAFEFCQQVARPGNARHWKNLLRAALQRFFDNGSSRGAYGSFEAMREAGDEFGEVAMLIENFAEQAGRIDCEFSFQLARKTLIESASSPAVGPVRLEDSATVGRLASGQIPPAKIVCAVGMGGDGFPRNPPRHSFDIVERAGHRSGDRDPRHEDRFAFLEALLAARRAFIVTYTGRDQSDDSEIPPSVVVDELHEYLVGRFAEPAPDGEQDSFRFDHPLQAFSTRYFSGGKALFSYSRTMFDAAKMLREQQRRELGQGGPEEGANRERASEEPRAQETDSGESKAPNRFGEPIEPPDASRRKLSLSELHRFFSNPAGGFLRERFAVRLRGVEAADEEVEPLYLNNYQWWGLREEILQRTDPGHEREVAIERVESRLLASGKLPYGGFGALAWDVALKEVDNLRTLLRPHSGILEAEPQHIDLEIGEFRLMGVITGIGPDRMLYWRNGKKRAKDLIEIRLRQLAWMAAGNRPLPMTAIWTEENKEHQFPAPVPGTDAIDHWLEAWWLGLSRPLRFFPKSSVAYAEALGKGGKHDTAMEKARYLWGSTPWGSGPAERDEPDNAVVWDLGEDDDPLKDDSAVASGAEIPTEMKTWAGGDFSHAGFAELAEKLLVSMFKSMPQ